MPATAAAVAEIPAPVIVAVTAHNAENAPVYHLLIALMAAASDAVRPLSTRLTTTALKIAMGAIPSDRVVTNGISWWPTTLPPATATPLAPAIDRCHYCHYYLAATARVTRRDHRHSRNCGKQLQKAEILWEISNPVWLDLIPALGACLRSRAAEEAAQAALTEGMAAAQHARASHSVVVVLSTNGAIGLLCHVKIRLLIHSQFKPAATNVAERCSTMPLLPVALVGRLASPLPEISTLQTCTHSHAPRISS